MIKKFKTTEKSVRLIEADNTLVIEVELRADKNELKKNIEHKLGVKIKSINTLIRDNKKFAYVKLNEKNPAIYISTKFGLI